MVQLSKEATEQLLESTKKLRSTTVSGTETRAMIVRLGRILPEEFVDDLIECLKQVGFTKTGECVCQEKIARILEKILRGQA